MIRTHLITGILGQDGIWLSRQLLRQGDRVVGTISPTSDKARLVYLEGAAVHVLDLRDHAGFARLVSEVRPDLVHNLAAMTSVGASWEGPDLVEEINHLAVRRMLETIADGPGPTPTFVQASSAEIFGPVAQDLAVDELTPLNPVSPYAEAKAAAHEAVARARHDGLRATNLILFGHTSALHPSGFAVPRLTEQAAEVGLGRRASIALRDPSIQRDWGSARDYVRAFADAADAPAGDYVIATGQMHTLAELGTWALEAAGAPVGPVAASGEPSRPNDFGGVRADPSLAARELGWVAQRRLRDEVISMVEVATRRLSSGVREDPDYVD